jgi:hypothetical protein
VQPLLHVVSGSQHIPTSNVCREVPRIVDLYTRWCAWKGPAPAPPDSLLLDDEDYCDTIISEQPPARLWAEKALYRVRKRQGQNSSLDSLLEEYWTDSDEDSRMEYEMDSDDPLLRYCRESDDSDAEA